MKIIRIYKSHLREGEVDTNYEFIQFVASSETVFVVVSDLEVGQIFQFKLNSCPMKFLKPGEEK